MKHAKVPRTDEEWTAWVKAARSDSRSFAQWARLALNAAAAKLAEKATEGKVAS